MADLNVINEIISVRNVLVAIASMFALTLWRVWSGLPAVMQQFILRRQVITAEKVSAVEMLRDEVQRLADRVKALEAEAAHWRERAHFHEGESIRKQAMLDGRSEVNQAAAVAAAEQRAEPSKAPESLKAAARLRRMGLGEDGEGI